MADGLERCVLSHGPLLMTLGHTPFIHFSVKCPVLTTLLPLLARSNF